MKTRLECEKVLGKDLYNKVEEYLENKKLKQRNNRQSVRLSYT